MEITYYGHSCFKLKGKSATVITDPYNKSVGFALPKMSADIVTISHEHEDHNDISRITGTTRRQQPYIIRAPGEYEVSQVGVFGWGSYHDTDEGKQRGKNTIYTIHMDNINLVHLGDLGHTLTDEMVDNLGVVDVLLVPVGGTYSLNAREAAAVVARLKPAIAIPMHYHLTTHNQDTYGVLAEVTDFMKEMEEELHEEKPVLKITDQEIPEETEVVVLKPAL